MPLMGPGFDPDRDIEDFSDDSDSCSDSEMEEDDDIDGRPKDIPALGPSTLEEVPLGPKGSRLKIEFDEEKAKSGYQDLKNAGKFWRAACLLGTRKDDLCSTLNPQPPFRLYPDLTFQSVSSHRTRLLIKEILKISVDLNDKLSPWSPRY